MSHFIFKAKHPDGEIYRGEKDAADRYELYKLLHETGDEIIEYKEHRSSGGMFSNISLGPLFNRVKTLEKINFARNLGSMLQAGLPLSRALSVLEQQTRSASFKPIISKLIADISKGSTFSDSLAKFPNVFPSLFVSMVHAGEQSGALAESLKVVATQLDSAYTLTKRVRGALMYPAVIVSAMVLIAVLMFIFVIPTLLKTFTDLNVKLPATTQIVLNISNLLQHDGIWVGIVVIILFFVIYYVGRTKGGRSLYHAIMLKLPIVGPLVLEVNTARTARTLASLLSAGVDIVESVSITSEVVQNVHYRSVLVKAAEAIKKGELMSSVFSKNSKLYPVFFIQMLSVGEETGKTGEMLVGVAHYYEDDVEMRTKDMSTVIEPFLILIIGAAVGFFAISMISPMYSLVSAV